MASKADTKSAQEAAAQALVPADNRSGNEIVIDQEFEDFFGSSSSDFGQADLSIPFIRIIQSLSPYVTRGDSKYDKLASVGQIVETVTPRFFDGERGIFVIPVLYKRSYTEWAPNRGGLVKDHGDDAAILSLCNAVTDKDGRKRMITPDGNELAEAAQYFVLYCTDIAGGFWEQAILSMSGTQWRKARDWNTNMSRVRITKPDGSIVRNPLPFVQCYHFTTQPEKKDNYNFMGWRINPHEFTLNLPNGRNLAKAAQEFRELALTGKVRGSDDAIADDSHIPGFDDSSM